MGSIDLYCERIGPDFWAEPVNALTNASFIVAAWGIWRFARRTAGPTPDLWLLIVTAVSIGVGSFLFHTFANRWSLLCDVVPILVFQLIFLWLYCRRIVGFSPRLSAVLLAAFLIAAIVFRRFPHVLNGSLIYLPALAVILILGIYHLRTAAVGRFDLLWAGGLLAVSLFFRSIDNLVCPSFQLGTHFIWHLANGGVIYLAARAYAAQRPHAHGQSAFS